MKENKKVFKSGFIAIVGRSNVGKSTLLNSLVGTKLAIVTPKPQTTRHTIHGVLHDERGQAVFVDTPGILFKSRDVLTKILNKKAKESLEGVDVVIYMVDPTREIGREEDSILRILGKVKIPKILVINKIDLRKPPFLEDYRALRNKFDATIEISALEGSHLKSLINVVFEYLPEGEPIYPEFQFTNIENKFWFAEIIREKIFHQLYSEAPYRVNVTVEEMDERENGMLYIHAIIEVANSRYRKIILGKGGGKIKEIGASARHDLERIMGKKIFLDLEVEVNERWMEKV
jgi:GTP-binding protein Era